MAKLKTIRIGKTFNKGNFESLRVDVELDVLEDSVDDVVADAHALIDYIAKGKPPSQLEARQAARVLDVRRRLVGFGISDPEGQ